MGLVNLDIDLLRTLVSIAETKSFTATGDRLFRTQSAISLQVKRLEEAVGQTLLERGKGKKVTLTRSGELVRSYALEILSLNDALVQEIENTGEISTIRLGTPDDYAQLIMPSVIKQFSSKNKNIEFQIVSSLSKELSAMVDQNLLDIALVSCGPEIHGVSVVKEPLNWVMAPGSRIASTDLVPLAVFPKGCAVRDLGIKALNGAGRRWRVAYSSNHFAPLRTAIASDEAIGILPHRAVPKDLVRSGPEHGLPGLATIELIVKVSRNSPDIVLCLATAIAQAFQPSSSIFGQ